jgi:phosphoenolpyruvate-protein phosphotransferase
MNARILRGHPTAPGAAIGRAFRRSVVSASETGTPEQEAERVERGLDLVAAELGELEAALRGDGHAADADIVETNVLMASDPVLRDAALAAARAGAPAARAIAEAAEPHVRAVASLDDPNLAARAADLRAIARRAGELATGQGATPPPGAIVIADDLGPGDVAAWARQTVAIVLAGSAPTAHAAIVARSLGIAMVTGAGADALAIPDGEELGVDADRGIVFRRPDRAARARLAGRIARARADADRALEERLDPAVTTDGRAVRLLANAGSDVEVEAALAAGAEGVGLLRTELAFLHATGWPDEAAHRLALAPVLAPLAHRIATVRILDFGGDKTPPFLASSGARDLLGPRGVRLSLAAPDAISAQVRALLAVSGEAVLRILIPMVTEAAEVDAVRAIVEEARSAVAPHMPEPLVGAMIEVPAAALNAAAIARRCDFLSVGTNDLVQYTLAADRENPDVSERAVAYHPSIVRLIARVVIAGHGAGIPVEVCGEAAGDIETLPLLVGLGVDELSVSPARLAGTRRMIRALSLQRTRAAAAEALVATTAADVAGLACAALEPPSAERLDQPGERVERR